MKIKIDFIAPPFCGHLNPLIELAKPLLGDNNFKIRFVTGQQKIEFLKSLGFNAIPILQENPEAMECIANTSKPVKNNPLLLLKQLKQNLAILPKVKKELKTLIKANNTNIVVADSVAIPAGIVCEELDIPWITIIPTPFAIETSEGTPSYLGGLLYSEEIKSKFRDYIGRKIVRVFKQLIQLIYKKELKELNYKIYRSDGTESAYSPYSILGLGMKEFEFKRDWPKAFKFIGPCCFSPEPLIDIKIPFNKYKNSVLVSIGTHLEWAKNDLINEVECLAQSFQDTLFIISFGRPQRLNIEPLYNFKNVLAYEYIPYSQYLNDFDVIIHHGGAGITYNCIKYCKPCIVIPHDYDQFDFAARIEYAKIGIEVKNFRSKKMVNALTSILSDAQSTFLDKLSMDMQKYNPAFELKQEILRLLNVNKLR